MNDENFDDFLTEIRPILKKHGLHNVVMGGDSGEKFFVAYGIEKMGLNAPELMQTALNAAKLYQSVREKVMNIFDKAAGRR